MATAVAVSLGMAASFATAAYAGETADDAAVAARTSAAFDTNERTVVDGIDDDYILKNVRYVHDNIGPRVAGTPADEASADYFANDFKELGYGPFTKATAADGTADYFDTFANERVNRRIGASVTIDGRDYTALAPGWADDSVYKGYETPTITGDTVYFANVDDAVAADASALNGRIVLTNRKGYDQWKNGGTDYADAARALQAKGAKAVVFFHNKYTVNEDGGTSAEHPFPAPTEGTDITIPVVLASYLDGRQIVKKLTGADGKVGGASATVVNRRNTHTSNILAVKEAAHPSDKYVIVGAHRDSVFGAEGANDNLSGSVNVLAIAKALKNVPTNVNVVFALWAAEEDGLIGSAHFYSSFLYPEDWGKQHVIAYYNMDMAATSQTRNSVLTIHTPYRDADGNPQQSVAGDVAERQAERYWDYTDGKYAKWWTKGPDDTVDLQFFGNCSDHATITGATGANGTPKLGFGEGIPSVYIFWGDRIGDGRNDVTEQNYHVVGDIYEWPSDEDQFTVVSDDHPFTGNYSIERATILASVFALAVYDTAAAPVQGIEDGGSYKGDVTFNVSYNYRADVKVDGKPVTVGADGAVTIPADDADHTVSVTDAFGESVSYGVHVAKGDGSGNGNGSGNGAGAGNGSNGGNAANGNGNGAGAGTGANGNGNGASDNADGHHALSATGSDVTMVFAVAVTLLLAAGGLLTVGGRGGVRRERR